MRLTCPAVIGISLSRLAGSGTGGGGQESKEGKGKAESVSFLGSMLFSRNVSGPRWGSLLRLCCAAHMLLCSRVVVPGGLKEVSGFAFKR